MKDINDVHGAFISLNISQAWSVVMQPRFLCTPLNPIGQWLFASQLYFGVFFSHFFICIMSHKHFWTLFGKKNNDNSCDFLQSETINQENNEPIFPVIIITSDRALSPQRKTNDDLQWLNAHVGVSVETRRKELKMLRGAKARESE